MINSIGIYIGKKSGINWSQYWATHNFSPSSTGAENVAALNTALTNYRHVKITEPGVYDFNNTIWIPSNTTLTVCAGVTFRKETGSSYSHMIGNKGILTQSGDTNIKFYGNGVNLDINGIDTYSNTDTAINPTLRLRSLFEFFKVTDFIVDDIYADNMDMTNQFFMSFSACTDGTISNIDQTSEKNSINILGGCKRLTLSGVAMNGTDDAFFVGIGYPNACVTYGDVEDITITDFAVSCPGVPAGYVSRLWGGSWGDWVNGMTTHDQESVVASNGRIYARGWNTGGNKVSTVEPTHTDINLHPTLADGIEWWLMDGTGYNSSVRRITYKNIALSSLRTFFEINNNYVTTGTEGDSIVEDIVCDNISIPANYDKYIIYQSGYIGNFTIKNSTLNTFAAGASRGIMGYIAQYKTCDKLIIDNCTFDLTGVEFVFYSSDYSTLDWLDITNSSIKGIDFVDTYTRVNCTFGKLTITGGTYEYTGGKAQMFGRGCLNGDNTLLTGVTLKGLERFVYVPYINQTSVIRFVDCIFATALAYIAVVTVAGCNIDVIMTGTTFIDPSQYLFYCNQGAATNSLSIDVSDSSGSVTPAKVRNGVGVVVIACDLTYV